MAKKNKRISSNSGGKPGNGSNGGSGGVVASASASGMDSPDALSATSTSLTGNAGTMQRAKASSSKSATASMLPAEVQKGDWTVVILAFMIFLAPAVGVPHEEMLQDTLKSIVAGFAAVSAGLLFFWHQRNRREGLRWHAIMWLPLSLMAYALGSMVWSHTYLGGVEAIRWFIFSLILFLGINTFSRERFPYILEGIHWGACVASLWTALQFWVDFTYFPQGPNPASTFVNRNFFAEFVVCTFPFTLYLLAQAKSSARVTIMAFTLGFNMVALMMTGTRGALAAMWILVGIVFPMILFLYRRQFRFMSWDSGKRILACGVLLATIGTLGLIKSGNPKVIADRAYYGNVTTAFDMAFARTASISTSDGSFGVRMIMWKATGRIIQAKPWTGVGAGAWEVMLPLYQAEGSQLETDYYVHNEILQLLAEYGLTGLIFLIALIAYLTFAAWKTLRNRSPEGMAEAPIRAISLAGLLAFLIISNIGFPWRLASTDCMFALSLALLASSDARLQIRGFAAATRISWKPAYSQIMAVFMIFCLALTAYISQQSAAVEQKIVRAVKLSLAVSQSKDYNNPKWDKTKKEILTLTRDAVDINTHYRKITPMVADELAKWGDWKNAVWVWESVVISRPYVVAIMSNIARGYAQMGNNEKALEFLARCEKLQPKASSVRSLKIILMSRTGKEPEAALLAKQSLEDGIYDFDLINAAYVLGMRKGDFDMAIKSLEIREKAWSNLQVDSLLKLGGIYTNNRKDDVKALASYKAALDATPPAEKEALRKQIPPAYLAKL
jgi:O-antigen ligase